jgi:hypothetical protein
MIVRVCLACLILVLLDSCGEPSQEEVARKIAASEELRQIDKICTEFPKPPGFRQIKKGIPVNTEITSVYYQYSSNLSFTSVRNFYQDAANRGNYILVSENYIGPEDSINLLRFLRDDVGITLEHRPPAAIFNIDCIR